MKVLATVAIVTAALGCIREPAPTETAPPRFNVVVVMVDTLRADHMSLYGYERATTPFIDEMARHGVVFDWAYSQASCTYPSVNSLLTSRYPQPFIDQPEGRMGFVEGIPTLQEILKEHGFNTVAVSASHIVRATPNEYNPTGGFDRGFDSFVEGCRWLHGGCLNAKISDQLDLIREPFFLYAHYMEPHAPYAPPANYTRQFAGRYDGHDFVKNGDPNPIGEMLYNDGPDLDLKDCDIQHLIDLYDDEIRSFDNVFRRLIQMLRDKGVFDRTMIALVADHGEEFLEHGHITHCRGIWATLSHVPLVLWIPGVPGDRHDEAAVGNIDLVPTLLSYLDIDADYLGFEGASLRPVIERAASPQRFAFSDQGRFRSVADSRFHLIFDGEDGQMTLFETAVDPLEQNDMYDPDHPAAVNLSAALDSWLRETGQLLRLEEALASAQAKEDELRALGYLQ